MPKVFIITTPDRNVQYVPASSSCQSGSDAAEKLGLESGKNCTVKTAITPSGVSAAEWIAQQKKTTPTPTTPPSTPAPTPTTTTATTTTEYPTSNTGLRELTVSEKSQWIGVTDWDVTIGSKTTRMTGDYSDILYRLEMQGEYPGRIKPSQEYYDEYEYYRQFLEQNPDWPDVDIKEYFANRQTFLDSFSAGVPPGEVSTAKVGFTDAQTREYNLWWDWYNKYHEVGEWKPVSEEDYFNNRDKALALLDIFKERGAAVGEYEISPEEAARRREESYEESRYAAQERYTETPELYGAFGGWISEQGQLSGAMKAYVESEYPSLRSEFEAGQPRYQGGATREEAWGLAKERESAFKAWLPGEVPGLYQEYMSQRPSARGERYWEQSPSLRTVNW